ARMGAGRAALRVLAPGLLPAGGRADLRGLADHLLLLAPVRDGDAPPPRARADGRALPGLRLSLRLGADRRRSLPEADQPGAEADHPAGHARVPRLLRGGDGLGDLDRREGLVHAAGDVLAGSPRADPGA